MENGIKKCKLKEYETFAGQFQEWLIIEVGVFTCFLFTMTIIMIKSRFLKVGTDNTS